MQQAQHTQQTSQAYKSGWYDCQVMHHRVKPVAHRFTYSVASFLFDLSELAQLDRELRGFGWNRPALFSLYDADYVAEPQQSLEDYVQQLLAQHQYPAAARIELLCMPRHLGYSFNPLAIFFCYDHHNALLATLYQVSNTFGGRHLYLVGASQPEGPHTQTGNAKHLAEKAFFVSPFIALSGQYKFRLSPPREHLKVLIRQEDDNGLLLNATLTGKRQPLTGWALYRLSLMRPFFTYKVMLGIHYEALRLWLKKVPLVRRTAEEKAQARHRSLSVGQDLTAPKTGICPMSRLLNRTASRAQPSAKES